MTSPVSVQHTKRRASAQFQANPANLYNMGKDPETPKPSRSPTLAHFLAKHSTPPATHAAVVTVHSGGVQNHSEVAAQGEEWFRDCGFSSLQEDPVKDVP